MSCVDIMTREGNNGQVDNSSTRATGYIIYNEKTGPEFVLPISSPGFPKNGGWLDVHDICSRLLTKSIAIDEGFFCGYQLIIDWPIPIDTN